MIRRHGVENEIVKQSQYRSIVFVVTNYINNLGLLYGYPSCKVHWLAIFATLCFLSTYILQVIAVFLAKDDSERLFECLSVLCFCGVGLLKLRLLWTKHDRWNFLISQITEMEKQQLQYSEDTSCLEYESDNEDEGNEYAPYISRYNERFNATSTILLRIYTSTLLFFTLSPLVEYAFRTLYLNESLGYPHILPLWAPLDEISVYGYLPGIICETVAAFYCAFVHITFDMTAVGVMIFLCGQFNLLRHCSERIGGNGKICNATQKRDARATFRIQKFHRIHITLVESVAEFNKLMKNLLGVYFFVSTCTLCSLAARLKMETMSKVQLVTLVQYMCASVSQLFVLCYYGDAVFNESAITMGQGPFGAALWCLGPKARRDAMMLGVGMMQAHSLQAGPFNVLNLPAFIQIVRTAYSCYAVIKPK